MKTNISYRVFLLLAPLVLAIFACGDQAEPETINVIEQILLIAEKNALSRYTIDWEDARNRVENKARKEGVEAAIFDFLGILGDNHSIYISKNNTVIRNSGINCERANFEISLTDEFIGYIKVGAFNGSGIGEEEFATAIHEEIKRQDHVDLKGWIVDLSGNEGGNMYPMIAGIGPLLGNGEYGFFVTADDIATPWGYNDGRAYLNSRFSALTRVIDYYETLKPNPKIAIVMDNQTASAGEAVAICFLERPGIRIFGQSSCGLTTANIGYPLINGGRLFLTTSIMADRNQNLFGASIHPDVVVHESESLNEALNSFFN